MKKLLILFIINLLCACPAIAQNTQRAAAERKITAQKDISHIISSINRELPVRIDECTVITKAYLDYSGNFVQKYQFDESLINMTSESLKQLRSYLQSEIYYDKSNFASIYWDLIVLKKNLKYIYVGNKSKRQYTITFTYNELRNLRHFASWL